MLRRFWKMSCLSKTTIDQMQIGLSSQSRRSWCHQFNQYCTTISICVMMNTYLTIIVPLSRFPFYYELKIIFLIWLISPVSRGSLGSSLLYRKLVHPNLMKREDEIDRWMGRVQVRPNLSLKFKSMLPLFSISFTLPRDKMNSTLGL